MISKAGKVLIVAVFLLAAGAAWAANGDISPAANLSSAQIVEQMQRHNQARTQALKHYKSVRHYQVEYRGFSKSIVARMDVEVAYEASTGKSFRIVSQSGSKLLCEKVLKRAVESEKEAAQDKGATALTAANYKFDLVGTESLGGRPAYILDVEPVKESKFLYRGKIWVDAADFALAKVEAEPAKNPSFWISRTRIQFTNAKRGDFWLPEKNRSETKVRIGGTAVLTIDYGVYQIS
jgi:outer membrane lipoprotein-sorting protein